MDMMTIRKMVMAQMAGAKVKTGTFIGNGTNTVTIDIGFEPDVVVIDSGHKYNNAGFTGLMQAVLIRGVLITNICHQTDTATNSPMYSNPIGEGEDEWGYKANPISYTSYATYSDGELTLSNANRSGTVNFKNGHQYTWTAFKK